MISISLSGSEQPGAAQVSVDNALVSEGSDWYIFTFSGTYIVPLPRLHPQCGFLITWDWLGWNCEETMSNGSLWGCGNLRWPPIGPSMKTFFTSHSTPFLHLVCLQQIIWPPVLPQRQVLLWRVHVTLDQHDLLIHFHSLWHIFDCSGYLQTIFTLMFSDDGQNDGHAVRCFRSPLRRILSSLVSTKTPPPTSAHPPQSCLNFFPVRFIHFLPYSDAGILCWLYHNLISQQIPFSPSVRGRSMLTPHAAFIPIVAALAGTANCKHQYGSLRPHVGIIGYCWDSYRFHCASTLYLV